MAETYFITGAQGCIGSWIVKALAERGDTPVVFDRSSDTRRLSAIIEDPDLETVRFVTGDVRLRHPYFWAPFVLVGDWKTGTIYLVRATTRG